jgi:hypothetical protein
VFFGHNTRRAVFYRGPRPGASIGLSDQSLAFVPLALVKPSGYSGASPHQT